MKPIYALSIKQPWAWLICAGYKDIENRNWKLPERMNGERIYVHASTKPIPFNNEVIDYFVKKIKISLASTLMLYSNNITKRAIIGEVTIKYCTDRSNSPWFTGKYGFVLSDPILYDKPIPCKGKLGFFIPEFEVLEV